MRYLEKLVGLLESARISDGLYIIRDEKNNILSGLPGTAFQLGYKDQWEVRFIEMARGNLLDLKKCNSEREACIEFLRMTDSEFHLASHIPEFEGESQ